MIVLSHRGYWVSAEEKNSAAAFERSFACGFGTETDIRDLAGTLVISHDMPDSGCMSVESFLELYCRYDKSLPLALNIKADGLQTHLKELLYSKGIVNYFVFDMSVPDALGYVARDMNAFTRQSEYEVVPSFYDQARGVWLDEFRDHWISEEVIAQHLQNRKSVCIVSPELHRREFLREWEDYRRIERNQKSELMICTDVPVQAREFFNDNH